MSSFVTKSYLETQFRNFASRIGVMFHTKNEVNALMADGRTAALVFDTKTDLDAWMEDADNTAGLKAGQNIYIKEKDTPDYWWDGEALQVLETEKVVLNDYVTAKQLETALAGYPKNTDVETENIDFSTFFEG